MSENPIERDLYSRQTVSSLFDEMSKTYGFVNLIASFGFTFFWRRALVAKLRAPQGNLVVVDLMTGMGELFRELRGQISGIQKVRAVDFSAQMCARAREEALRNPFSTEIIEADVFDQTIADQSADIIVCSFGLKTFSLEQQKCLATEVNRILKPGGQFSFIEISIPQNPLLRLIYKVYLNFVIPLIGRICLGNPDNYRMLGRYTEKFGNSRQFQADLAELGLEARYFEHFFGCSSGVCGTQPR